MARLDFSEDTSIIPTLISNASKDLLPIDIESKVQIVKALKSEEVNHIIDKTEDPATSFTKFKEVKKDVKAVKSEKFQSGIYKGINEKHHDDHFDDPAFIHHPKKWVYDIQTTTILSDIKLEPIETPELTKRYISDEVVDLTGVTPHVEE